MEEWKEYRLGDIISIKSGFAYKGDMIGYGENVLLGMGCVSFKERFLLSGARAYAGDCADRYCANSGDIVLATRQQSDNLPILGMPAMIPDALREKKIIIGANLYRVDNESDFSNEYIYWLLKTPLYVNHIHSCQSGTTVRMITKANIEDFRFKAPNRKERDKIVSILKSLDDKIENNRRINENLEQQAQALFKSWFVDFEPFKNGEFVESELGMIPKGWRVVNLEDVCTKITDGVHNTVKDDLNGKYLLLSCKNIKGGKVAVGTNERRINEETFLKLRKRTMIDKGDILLSSVGTLGEMVLLNESLDNIEFQRSVAIIKPNCDKVSSHFLYYSLQNQKDHIVNAGHGAVQQCLFISDIANFTTIMPPRECIDSFTKVVSQLTNQISINNSESRRLAELRDTLLPKLMSGEIKVEDIKI